jgi:hypothetical protein
MATAKLTKAQCTLLELVAAGLIRRDDTALYRPLYTPYRTDTHAAVRRDTMDILTDRDLAKYDFTSVEGRKVPVVLTPAGRAALDAVKQATT